KAGQPFHEAGPKLFTVDTQQRDLDFIWYVTVPGSVVFPLVHILVVVAILGLHDKILHIYNKVVAVLLARVIYLKQHGFGDVENVWALWGSSDVNLKTGKEITFF
ncbi:hypothetical protein AVEN_79762-1, partial [Araneus ventricosus]